jgi:signal transduction histidine kinase
MQRALCELAAAALGVAPQAAMVIDSVGKIILRNLSADALLPTGPTVDDVLVEDGGRPALDWSKQVAMLKESAGRTRHRGLTLMGRGGRQVLADIYLRTIPDGPEAPGAPIVLVLVEDVSARVSMERQLAASERLAAVGQLSAKIAHELNNPLDGVLRYIGLAQRADPAEQAQYLTKARSGLLRMADIVRELVEQGRAAQTGAPRTPVEKLLDEALDVMQPRAQALGVTVVCDLAGGEALVSGNLFQVFCNVIKNALDAMPGGGTLTVRMRADDKRLTVEFADTGVGLTVEDAERAFQPFYTTKPPGEGAGLGLSICREIVTRLGGTISAAPRAEGGATVTIRVPQAQE